MRFDRAAAAATAVMVVAMATGCGLQQGLDSAAGAVHSSPTAAPAINGKTTTGTSFSWSSVAGHAVVLDFWGSWCGPCRAEQPDINSLQRRYASRGVVFVGIDMRDDSASARAFEHTYGVAYQSVDDSDETIAAAYDVAAPPVLVVVDQRGQIMDRFLGTVVGVSDDLDRVLGRV